MYSLTDLQRAIRYPPIALRKLNKLYHTRGETREYNSDGVNIFEEDWDNLIILDGCRADCFKQLAPKYGFTGRLESRISRGSATTEFLEGNFDGRDLTDTVYVTASTMLYQDTQFKQKTETELHAIIDVWETAIEHGDDGVPPAAVAERVRNAADKYADKRILAHFVQPHAPYLGPEGRRQFPDFEPNPLGKRFKGELDISDETLKTLYRENLELVLPYAADLCAELPGKTVVSADHGMLVGDREHPIPIKGYGHPSQVYVPGLVQVPWFISEPADERKQITADAPETTYRRKRTSEIDQKARAHLRQMGYLE